jgi:glutathione synthase/RimK-type ligase-like ATP-grasp enzyme
MEDRTGFFIYDHLAFPALQGLGWQVEEIPWSIKTDWSRFDAVVIRSPWDYQQRVPEFLQVLKEIEEGGSKLLNSLDIIKWNLHMSYLRELSDKGVPVVPTLWMDGFSQSAFDDLSSALGAESLVIKPTVGANADDTYWIRDRRDQGQIKVAARVFDNRECMVQPFIESIVGQGEYSLFYFDGTYSHAIQKTPKSGDFRVQEEHAGMIKSVNPSAQQLEIGRRAINSIGESLLYARVDLVELGNNQWALIELELIEPSLYFPYCAEAPSRFAKAINDCF